MTHLKPHAGRVLSCGFSGWLSALRETRCEEERKGATMNDNSERLRAAEEKVIDAVRSLKCSYHYGTSGMFYRELEALLVALDRLDAMGVSDDR